MSMHRRSFVRGACATAVGLPLLEVMTPRRASAAPVPPLRFLVFVVPLGTFPERFWPRAAGETPFPIDERGYMDRNYEPGPPIDTDQFDLGWIMQPLERHKRDLLIPEGIDMVPRAEHSAYGSLLTATEAFGGGISVDQEIARQIGGDTPIKSLQLGIGTGGKVHSRHCVSFYGPGMGAPAQDDPMRSFQRIFAGLPPSGQGSDEAARQRAAIERELARKRSLLDGAIDDLRSLSDRVGAADRRRVEQHMDAVRALENRLASVMSPAGSACAAPMVPTQEQLDRLGNDRVPVALRTQFEQAAMAFACDRTRVVTVQLFDNGSAARHPWLGINDQFHPLSHTNHGPQNYAGHAKIATISRWHAEELSRFIDLLKSIREGEGTLFDNTLIVWLNGFAKGNAHVCTNSPTLLAGSAQGRFRTGRYIRFPYPGDREARRRQNDLLLTLARGFGSEVQTFGDPAHVKGVLPGLLA